VLSTAALASLLYRAATEVLPYTTIKALLKASRQLIAIDHLALFRYGLEAWSIDMVLYGLFNGSSYNEPYRSVCSYQNFMRGVLDPTSRSCYNRVKREGE
jgi:hypothetical protein